MAKYIFNSVAFLIIFLDGNDYTIDEFCDEFEIDKKWFLRLLNSDYSKKEKQYIDFCKKIGVKFKKFFIKA